MGRPAARRTRRPAGPRGPQDRSARRTGRPGGRGRLANAADHDRSRHLPGYTCGIPTRTLGADGTPPAARRQRAHLPRLLRADRPAPDHLEGRAGHGGVRLHEHRAARDRGRAPRPHRGRLRPGQADLPPRALRGVQGHPDADAGRHAGSDPEGPRRGEGPGHPGLRAGGLRGRRRDRDAHGPGRGRRPRGDDPHGRPGHAPAGHRAHAADGQPPRRCRQHGGLRPREDR